MPHYDIEEFVEKVGGFFPLSILVQKRMKELNRGEPKLVEMKSNILIEIVFQEILENKIELVPENTGLSESDTDFFSPITKNA